MLDYRTQKHIPTRIEGKGFIVLESGLYEGPGYKSNVMTYKVIVYAVKKIYLVEGGRINSTKGARETIKKHTVGKCYINSSVGVINVTNHNLPDVVWKDYQGKVRISKPNSYDRIFFKYGKKITEITQEELNSIVVEEMV